MLEDSKNDDNSNTHIDSDKKPVDWWNRYVVLGAVIVLICVFGFWVATQFSSGGKRIADPPAQEQTE